MSVDIERIPPHSEAAERCLLGCLLLRPELVERVMHNIVPSDFYVGKHDMLFGTMAALAMTGCVPDAALVVTECERVGTLENVGGREYLRDIVLEVGGGENYDRYADIVRTYARQRELLRLGMATVEKAYAGAPPEEVVADVRRRVEAITATAATTEDKWWSLDDIDAMPEEAVDWVLPGYVARGNVTLLGGAPGCGKSTIAYALAGAMATGAPLLGMASKRGRALILSEESRGPVQQKLRRFGCTNVGIKYRRDIYPRKALGKWVELGIAEAQRTDAALLVIDTWGMFAGFEDDGENSASETTAAVNECKRAASSGLAVVIVHHLSRAGNYRGSIALEGDVDICVKLTGQEGGEVEDRHDPRLLKVTKSRFDLWPESVVFRMEGDAYVVEGTTRERARQDLDDEVFAAVDEAPWSTQREIRAGLRKSNRDVLDALRRLHQANRIQRHGSETGGAARYAVAGLSLPTEVAVAVRGA